MFTNILDSTDLQIKILDFHPYYLPSTGSIFISDVQKMQYFASSQDYLGLVVGKRLITQSARCRLPVPHCRVYILSYYYGMSPFWYMVPASTTGPVQYWTFLTRSEEINISVKNYILASWIILQKLQYFLFVIRAEPLTLKSRANFITV